MDINNIVNSTRTRNARLLDDINNKILNREYYKFKYLPLEGALPGLYFQQQTEDAINDIGNVAYATEKVADEALQVAQQAYNIALAALETANNALAAAQTAQQTANTALNIANNALSVGTAAATTAAAAQNRADEAYDLAGAAQKAADAAKNTADAAQEAANSAANDATNALTKAEDALTKIEQLSVLNYYNNLTEATDVNTLVDIHRWYLQASNNPNAPETNPGFLNVDNDYNDSVCKQLWVSETTGAIYNRFGQIVENSDPATVSSWSEWYKLATKADIDGTTTDLTEKITTVANNLATHEADVNNPHKVTAEQLGLTTVYQYKGSVATYADLPTTGQKVGDVWNVETADPDHGIKAGDNVAWDGAQWDILGGNHDLSGYAQLNSANTFTALNTFRANIAVSNGTTAGSSSTIQLGIKPSSATMQADIGTDVNGAVILHSTENQGYAFRIGSQVNRLYLTTYKDGIAFKHMGTNFATYDTTNGAKWLGNAKTATQLETARKINGVAFDGTEDITIEAGGGGDVTAPGDNNFTGVNTFNNSTNFGSYIAVRSGAGSSASGVINLGRLSGSTVQGASLSAVSTGQLNLTAGTGKNVVLQSREAQTAVDIAEFATNQATIYPDTLQIGSNSMAESVGIRRSASDTYTITLFDKLVNVAQFNGTTHEASFDANDVTINSGKSSTFAIKNADQTILDHDGMAMHLRTGDSNIGLELGSGTSGWNLQCPANTNDVRVAQRLYVGSQGGTGNGVISADNTENCLYFCGTAENTYFATPNTGNTINYQSAANCYLINCSINNPSSLNMNFSNMNFKATVGSVPYMCKTLTFWLPVSATVPAVTWTFPTNSAVYYPKGVAPALTANANNIINVIAIVDDTGSFSIQVCDTVVLPYSG